MLLPSWHVHRECAFLLAETPRSVSDWCVAEALVQLPPLESVLLDKSKSVISSAASCSASGSAACLADPCLHVIELRFHLWHSCSLHLRFNQLRSDVYLLASACDDLPCILDTNFIGLILDKSCRLIPFCDPSCAGFTSSALHLSVRAFSLAYDSCNSALCVTELPNCCWKVFHNFSEVSSSDCVLSSSGSVYSVIRLASVSVGQTTLRSWSVETARCSFTALACFRSFLFHCQCALSDLASPARLSLGVAVVLVGMT